MQNTQPSASEKRLLYDYLMKYRRELAIGTGMLVVVSILDCFLPLFLKFAIDALDKESISTLAWIAAIYFFMACLQALGRYYWRIYLKTSAVGVGRDLRGKFAAHALSLTQAEIERSRAGDLTALATNDSEAVRTLYDSGVVTIVDAIIYSSLIPLIMFSLSWRLSLLVLPFLISIPFIVYGFQNMLRARFRALQTDFGSLSACSQECILGVRTIKAFAAEERSTERFRKCGEQYLESALRLARYDSALAPGLEFIVSLSVVLLAYVGGQWVLEEQVSVGTFVAFQRYVQTLLWPMQAVAIGLNHWQRARAGAGRINAVISRDVEADGGGLRMPAHAAQQNALEFKNLSFRYAPEGRPVLDGISLTIESGERIALLGDIGSGKSTLLKLIPRLYPVERGSLIILGQDSLDWDLESLREAVRYAPQDAFLFSATVRENLLLGAYGSSLSVEQAAASAAMAGEIAQMPKTFDTLIGERGVTVSGGQKQRLALARALIKPAAIYLFDDIFSAVDLEAETRILSALAGADKNSATLLATQRLSTITHVDRIVVLSAGRIIQSGSHAELLRELGGWYHRFYDRQRLLEEVSDYSSAEPLRRNAHEH